jgi:dTMP kinase
MSFGILLVGDKGLFVTFEGGEGAGKTTLIERLEKYFLSQGRSVLRTREPGGTPLGEEIRKILLHHKGPLSPYAELALFLASRAQHVQEVIRPAIERGEIVLCDRFNDSSVAYQGMARGLGMQEVAQVADFLSEGLKPDLTLYLDIDPKEGLRRAGNARAQDRIESETLAFHTKIREAYLEIARKEPKRFVLLDASKSPDEVFKEALKHV